MVNEASKVNHLRKEIINSCQFQKLASLAPSLPAISWRPRARKKAYGNIRGTLDKDLKREEGVWTSTGRSKWRENKHLLPGISPVRRLPEHWETNEEGRASTTPSDGRIRSKDATEDERRCSDQIAAGYEPASITQAEEDPMRAGCPAILGLPTIDPIINAEEEEFGSQRLGFPTDRRPSTYWCKIV